jgi:outer membrane protein assembly factor BamA
LLLIVDTINAIFIAEMKKIIMIVFAEIGFLFTIPPVFAQGDFTQTANEVEKKKDTYWTRLFRGNIDHTHDRTFDGTFVVAPSYTREGSFGIVGIVTGLYRVDRTDSIMPPSNVSIAGNASLLGFYGLSMNGNNYFKGNRSRLSYNVGFTLKPLDFWGISYEACARNPATNYTRQQVKIDVVYPYEIANNLYIGGVFNFTNTRVSKIDDMAYLEGQELSHVSTGAGLSVQYDSRDFIPHPTRGVNLMFQELVFPEWAGSSGKTLFRTTVNANYYQALWTGGIVAIDIYGEFNNDDIPWAMKEELGNGYRMRGYYAGRYMDNNIASCQLELRQDLYKRFGFAAWIGCGSVFPALHKFQLSNVLPTYGVGLRWEFKHNVNLRVDYGFGHETSGFTVSIGEAF